jgi:hypothetical protein
MAKASGSKTAPVDYVAKIGAFDWPKLEALWTRLSATPKTGVAGWASGKALEHLILRAFELSGAEVIWPYHVKLGATVVEQIDGIVLLEGHTCMVEVKDQVENVNVEPLAKLRNQLLRRPAGVVGSVFSRSGFTDPAVTLAYYMAPQAVLLWQGPEIAFLLGKRDFIDAFKLKYRALVQHGKPDYDIRAGAL